ncbi:MAG TPA: protein-glutamate O-methyltransferase CheR [Pyrinomonadaceae bacterium]|nr:protein-glutamate O-methyltransferase CheR [Pyrinomonadaceae bacterium]
MTSRSQNLVLPEGTSTLIRNLIHERTGMSFDNGKCDLLMDKLSPLVIERGFSSYLDYYYLLKYDETARPEWQNVMNALSVQETYFWREIDQVRALVQTLLPQHHAQQGKSPIRIWSAACATGEEPLTIAIALNEAGWFERASIQIMASDASSKAIDRAAKGVYRPRALRSLPLHLRDRYFEQTGADWRIRNDIHARIKWSIANLIDERQIAPLASADFIFCRNVFIYFSEDAIRRVVRSFAGFIRPPGYLFIGAAESLLRLSTDFNLTEVDDAFVYLKRARVVSTMEY